MSKLKDYWWVLLVFGAVAGWLWDYWGVRADASDAKQAIQQQADINAKLTAIVIQNDTKLGVYLELMGFDDSIAREWSELQREAPHDTNGVPIPWDPWLVTDDELQVGCRYMFNDSDRVLVDTLWNFRKAKK
jgi:hypothetical protein